MLLNDMRQRQEGLENPWLLERPDHHNISLLQYPRSPGQGRNVRLPLGLSPHVVQQHNAISFPPEFFNQSGTSDS